MPMGACGKMRKGTPSDPRNERKGEGKKPAASVLKRDGRKNTNANFGKRQEPFAPYYEKPEGFIHDGK